MEIKPQFTKYYLDSIKNETFKRMDGKEYGGNGDGKISTQEAYNDLPIDILFNNLKEGSKEYERLKTLTDTIYDTLVEYSGEDEEFSAEEWAAFLNGSEWGEVLDAYHSSSNYAKIEMGWVDRSKNCMQDSLTTKGEVKVGILNNLAKNNFYINTDEIEALVDKYAGNDGIFTVAEYTAMLNDKKYKAFLKQYGITAFDLSA